MLGIGGWDKERDEASHPRSPTVAGRSLGGGGGGGEDAAVRIRCLLIDLPGGGIVFGVRILTINKENQFAIRLPTHQIEEAALWNGRPGKGELLLDALVRGALQIGLAGTERLNDFGIEGLRQQSRLCQQVGSLGMVGRHDHPPGENRACHQDGQQQQPEGAAPTRCLLRRWQAITPPAPPGWQPRLHIWRMMSCRSIAGYVR